MKKTQRFHHLYHLHKDIVYKYSFKESRAIELADAATIHAFYQLYLKLDSGKEPRNVTRFLFIEVDSYLSQPTTSKETTSHATNNTHRRLYEVESENLGTGMEGIRERSGTS